MERFQSFSSTTPTNPPGFGLQQPGAEKSWKPQKPVIHISRRKFKCDDLFAAYLVQQIEGYGHYQINRKKPSPAKHHEKDVMINMGDELSKENMVFPLSLQNPRPTMRSLNVLPFDVPLSATGYIYAIFGKDILRNHFQSRPVGYGFVRLYSAEDLDLIYRQVYESLIMQVDAATSWYSDDGSGVPRHHSCGILAFINDLNTPSENWPDDEKLRAGIDHISDVFAARVNSVADIWLNERKQFKSAFEKRLQFHTSGRFLLIDSKASLDDHLYRIEEDLKLTDMNNILFVICPNRYEKPKQYPPIEEPRAGEVNGRRWIVRAIAKGPYRPHSDARMLLPPIRFGSQYKLSNDRTFLQVTCEQSDFVGFFLAALVAFDAQKATEAEAKMEPTPTSNAKNSSSSGWECSECHFPVMESRRYGCWECGRRSLRDQATVTKAPIICGACLYEESSVHKSHKEAVIKYELFQEKLRQMDKASKHCEKMAAKIKQQAEKLEKMRKREEMLSKAIADFETSGDPTLFNLDGLDLDSGDESENEQ